MVGAEFCIEWGELSAQFLVNREFSYQSQITISNCRCLKNDNILTATSKSEADSECKLKLKGSASGLINKWNRAKHSWWEIKTNCKTSHLVFDFESVELYAVLFKQLTTKKADYLMFLHLTLEFCIHHCYLYCHHLKLQIRFYICRLDSTRFWSKSETLCFQKAYTF